MKKKLSIFVLLISFLLWGCQDVITVDLEEGPVRLVVEGGIERIKDDSQGNQMLRLTTTAPYFYNDRTPPASGAEVSVTDEKGNRFEFLEMDDQPGNYYASGIIPGDSSTYVLSIRYNGDEYSAEENFASVAPIDTIYQKFIPESFFDEPGIRLQIDYTDPAGERNFYLWQQFQNGEMIIDANPGTKFSIIGSDEFNDGQRIIGKMPDNDFIYVAGDQGKIRQIGLSENGFNYFFRIYDQAGGAGLFSASPSGIRGNIINLSNPDLYALGYFRVSEVDEKSILIASE